MVRDIQEMVNRNRGGVSVYSPTRRIRPTGRVANAGTPQAILGGGQQFQQQPQIGTQSFGGMPAPQAGQTQLPGWAAAIGSVSAGNEGTTLDRLLAQARAGPVTQQAEPGGFWGSGPGKAIGTVVNNPVGRAAFQAFETLNYPRRIIQSTINEVADAFNGGDASFDDWTQQIGNEDFGFGHMVPDTGNTWIDRFIGLGGDILLDPLSYVGGAGLYSGIAGRSGRAGAAADALAAGARVGELTAEATAAKIGRWGFSRFDDAARAELRTQLPGSAQRILDRGYHFKVPFANRFWKIPGSQAPDWLLSRTTGRIRDTLSRSPIGGWMRYATNPNGMRDAVTTLVTGRGPNGMTAAHAAEVVNFNSGRKMAGKSFVARVNQLSQHYIREQGGGKSGNRSLSEMFRTAEAQGGTKAHEFYAAVRKMATEEFGINIPELPNYLPHFWTDGGSAWLKGTSQAAQDIKAQWFKTVDLDDTSSVLLHRKFLAGNTYTIAGHEFKLVDGSADEINKIFHRLEPDANFDLIDTDFSSTAARYAKSLEESVGLVGGLKKVLGSKSGLVRSLHDKSMASLITEEDLAALANRDTAKALRNQWRQASSLVKEIRDETRKGLRGISGQLGVEMRGALDELTTIGTKKKAELDRLLAMQIDLENQRGVGKYDESLAMRDGAVEVDGPHPSMEPTQLERQLETTYNELARRHAELERRLGELRPAAEAEAKELEAKYGKAQYFRSLARVPGKISAQREFQRLAAESAAVAMDAVTLETLMARLEINREAQALIDQRLNDGDFLNLAVADAESSPKYPGFADPTDDGDYVYVPSQYNDKTGDWSQPQLRRRKAEITPIYIGASPLQIHQDWADRRRAVLGMNNQRVLDTHARFKAQAKVVENARNRAYLARVHNREAIEAARAQLAVAREYQAGLKHGVVQTRGRYDFLERHHEWGEALTAFEEGELARLNNDYLAARKPVVDAEKVYDVELRKLQEIRDEQMLIARELDAENVPVLRQPMGNEQIADVRIRRAKAMGDRVNWHKSRAGRMYAAAQRNLQPLKRRLDDLSARIDRMTTRGGRFFFDSEGALQPKFTTGEAATQRLMRNRDDVLIPARNRAEEHYEAVREIWERIERQGVGVNSRELRLAQGDVKRAWKLWKDTQAKVADANRQLAKIPPKDVPDLGRITVQQDQLQRMIAEQARLQARVDEVTHRVDELGVPLAKIQDEIDGADAALEAHAAAFRAANAPTAATNTHEARLSDLNRQEQIRLELVESNFQGFKQDWEDMPELPPRRTDLGKYEGKFDDDPVILNALEAIHRLDVGARDGRLDLDVVTRIEDAMHALQAAQKPFDVPTKDTAEWAAVMEYSPQSRGGAMGAVGRGQAVAAQASEVLEQHIDELIEAGALSPTYAHEMFKRRLDLDRALDMYAKSPGPHIRHDIEQQASELGRITGFALRYKAAMEGGNEPSEALAAFLLSRQLKQESDNLKYQLGRGRDRLKSFHEGREELAYTRTLLMFNEQIAQRQFDIENEMGKYRAGEEWDKAQVNRWTKEINALNEQIALLRPPTYGALDDTIDGMVDYLLEGMISIDNATTMYNDARHITYQMQWPVRREAQLQAEIPRFQGELAAMKSGQARLQGAVTRARRQGKDVVRYTPYSTDAFTLSYEEAKALLASGGVPEHLRETVQRQISMSDAAYKKNPNRPRRQIRWREEVETGIMEIPLFQAEENLRINERMIDNLEHDIANKEIQLEVINGSAQTHLNRLDAELADIDTPPDTSILRQQNEEIRNRAHIGRRRYTDEEFQIRKSNRARIERAEGGKLHYTVVRRMREEAERYRKAIADFEELLGGDTTYMAIGHDQGVAFMRDLVTGKRMPNQRDWLIMRELIGNENAANAEVWVTFIDELIAGRRTATHAEIVDFFNEAFAHFGNAEMLDRMKERAIGSMADEPAETFDELSEIPLRHEDETVGAGDEGGRVIRAENMTFDEMRQELASAIIASANRQRQESIAEFNSMLKMFGMTFPDGMTGFRQRLQHLGIDQPNHRLLVARLRRFTIETMERMGYDPRNAIVDMVTDMRSRLGRVETMRRGLGAQLNRINLKNPNPEEFFLWYHSLSDDVNVDQIAEEARQFTRLTVPAEVEAVYAARLAQLQREIDDAVTAGDVELARSLTRQSRAVKRAQGSAVASAEAGGVSAAPSPVADAPPPVIDRQALTQQRDQAEAAITQFDQQIAALRQSAAATPMTQSSAEVTGQMEGLVAQATAAGKPEGSFSQAEINLVSQQALLAGAADDMAEVKRLTRMREQMTHHQWSDEPPELKAQAKALQTAWRDARDIERGKVPAVGDPSITLQIEDLTKQRGIAIAQRDAAERELSAADVVPTTATDNAGMHAQREALSAQRNQAIAAGDVAGIEDLTRQINQLDEELSGGVIDDAKNASASAYEDPLAGQVNEGQVMPSPEQETIPETVADANVPDSALADDEIGRELTLTQQQLSEVLQRHGGFANLSPTDQQLAGILASRIRKLTEIQNVRLDEARRTFLGTKLPEYQRYMRSQAASAAEGELAVNYDVMNILFKGTPSVHLSRKALQGPMGRVTQGATSVRARPAGAINRGAISPQLEVMRNRLLPRKALREELEAAKVQLAADEQRILGEVNPLAERAAAEPGRQARMEEIRRMHGEGPDMSDMTDPAAYRAEVESQTDEMADEMSRLQRDADIAERLHTERMAEIDMNLANVRQRVMWASRDYASFEEFRGQLERSISKSPTTTKGMHALIADMRAVNAARKDLVAGKVLDAADEDLRGMAHIEAMLASAAEETKRLEGAQLSKDTLKRRIDDLSKDADKAAEVTKRLLADGWRIMAKDLLTDDIEGVAVSVTLANAIEIIEQTSRRPEFWKWIDKYTAFFKTYATAKPGFHVRNALSATFMNLVDGVRIRDMYQGARLWRQFERDPEFWMKAGVDPRIRDAFHAVFASGAGGQFQEFGIGTFTDTSTKFFRHLMNNKLTRWNRRVGSRVEGSARLAMALNSTMYRGATTDQALRRVSKFHFDYDELSDVDRRMRRVIPFWTFMSRNLPLQLEQMFINPRTYLQYQSLVRNFGEQLDPATPEYWLSQGAFTVDEHAPDREAPWYLAPDLPHLRVTEPLDALARGNWGKAGFSDINPLFLSPVESGVTQEKTYTGAPLTGYHEPQGPMKLFTPLFNMLGGTEQGGTSGNTVVDDRYAHLVRSTLPPVDFLERLMDPTGTRAGRQDETLYRAVGAPVYQLTPELRKSTKRSAYYDRQDQRQTQAELARL